MVQERLTLREMETQYPDKWLFITECKHNEVTEIISGIVTAHSTSRIEISKAMSGYRAKSGYKGKSGLLYTGDLREGLVYML